LVFLDGRYLDAPYTVSRRGTGIYINDAHLRDYGRWPPFKFDEVAEDPGVPPGLTKDSSFDDMKIPGKTDAWNCRKFRWLMAHYALDEARRRYMEYVKSLPFVKNVGPLEHEMVMVETFNGKKVGLSLTHRAYTPPTKEMVVQDVDRSRSYLEDRLAKGDCFFFFTQGPEISCAEAKAARDLGLIAEILRSARPKEEKALLLQRVGLLPGAAFGSLEKFLTNFQASDQLHRRITALVKEMGVKPRRLEDLPPQPLDPKLLVPPPAPGGAPPKGAP
jgi:hypothetical protein